MRFTARTVYAFHALVELARRRQKGENIVTLSDLSETCEIPLKFLVAVLANLRRAGIAESIRGKQGGYRLVSPPEAIRLSDVVRATESPKSPSTRRGYSDPLATPERLFFEDVRQKAEASAFAVLNGLTLRDALEALSNGSGEMYYI